MFSGLTVVFFLAGLGLVSMITFTVSLIVGFIFGLHAALWTGAGIIFLGLVWLGHSYWETRK